MELLTAALLVLSALGLAARARAAPPVDLTDELALEPPKPTRKVIRESDLPFLRALIPVMLAGAVPAERMAEAVQASLAGLDHTLDHLSPEMLKLTVQLFDVLALPITRGPLTGIWGSWEKAGADDVKHFLERWQNSSIGLLKMGHSSLLQLVMMAWYGRPESWAHCGYPGPPKV